MKRTIFIVTMAALVLGGQARAGRLYVTSNQIRVVDDAQSAVVGTIDLGQSQVRSMAFTADGSTAFVGHSHGVAVIDVATSTVRDTWSDRAIDDIVLHEGEGVLYTLEHASGEAYEVATYELTTGNEIRRYVVDHQAHDLTVAAGAERVYTTNIRRNTLSTFDRLSGESESVVQISTGMANDEGERDTYVVKSVLSPSGESLYLIMNGERAGLQEVSVQTGETVRELTLGHPAYVRDAVLSVDGTLAYLAAIDHLAVLDVASGEEIAWVDVGLPHQGIDVSSDGTRIYMANPIYNRDGGSVTVIDAGSLEIVERIAVPEISPFRVAALP